MGRMRALQGQNKGRDSSVIYIKLGFIVSLSILNCGSEIIVFLRKVRPLGRLPVWDELAFSNRARAG